LESTSGTSTTREKLSRPANTGLLAAGIPMVENLRGLERLPRGGIVFSAPPIAIVRGAAFPVRAFAEVP
jgi:kynurenine formamidase